MNGISGAIVNVVTDTTLDKRNDTNGRVERVKVYDITNDKNINWLANEPKPPVGHNPVITFMAGFCAITVLVGFTVSTIQMVMPSPPYEVQER